MNLITVPWLELTKDFGELPCHAAWLFPERIHQVHPRKNTELGLIWFDKFLYSNIVFYGESK